MTAQPRHRAWMRRPSRRMNGWDPQDVQQVLLAMRRGLLISEGWVADTRAPDPSLPEGWESAADFATAVRGWADDFALHVQSNQPVYVEVLCEAEGLVPRLARVAAEYGVPVYSGGGFGGLKGNRAFGSRAAARDVPTVVLAVSDFDDFGLNIAWAAEEDAIAWSRHFGACPGKLTFERIALTHDQAADHGLLDADGKAEVDGLPVPVMDAILREAIGRHQDASRRAELARQEQAEKAAIPEALRRALPQ